MDYAEHIARIHAALGIPADYASSRRMALVPEAAERVDVEAAADGRPRQLTTDAAHAWRSLREAAAEDGVILELVSAFRSVDHQRGIVERKRARGLSWEEIFRFSAAPGYSEHHGGRAIDLNTPGCPPLEVAFAGTPAFAWLLRHAPTRGWRLSFPEGNPHGVAFEPWHWLFTGGPTGNPAATDLRESPSGPR